jgi:hypothetical protein
MPVPQPVIAPFQTQTQNQSQTNGNDTVVIDPNSGGSNPIDPVQTIEFETVDIGGFKVPKGADKYLRKQGLEEGLRKKEKELRDAGLLLTDEHRQIIEEYHKMKNGQDAQPDRQTQLAIEEMKKTLQEKEKHYSKMESEYLALKNYQKETKLKEAVQKALKDENVIEDIGDLLSEKLIKRLEIDDNMVKISVKKEYQPAKINQKTGELEEYTLEDLIRDNMKDKYREPSKTSGVGGSYGQHNGSNVPLPPGFETDRKPIMQVIKQTTAAY